MTTSGQWSQTRHASVPGVRRADFEFSRCRKLHEVRSSLSQGGWSPRRKTPAHLATPAWIARVTNDSRSDRKAALALGVKFTKGPKAGAPCGGLCSCGVELTILSRNYQGKDAQIGCSSPTAYEGGSASQNASAGCSRVFCLHSKFHAAARDEKDATVPAVCRTSVAPQLRPQRCLPPRLRPCPHA